jgi:hypothetical protein
MVLLFVKLVLNSLRCPVPVVSAQFSPHVPFVYRPIRRRAHARTTLRDEVLQSGMVMMELSFSILTTLATGSARCGPLESA